MGTERDSKVFEGEATFRKARILEGALLRVVSKAYNCSRRIRTEDLSPQHNKRISSAKARLQIPWKAHFG